ncbi:MAG: TolB family protein [Dehalococcoidia bacterium]
MARPALGAALLATLLVGVTACSRGATQEPASAPVTITPRLLFADHSEGTTSFWLASPSEPADRTQLVRVSHDPEWGVRASLSPDGRSLAYTWMPPGARDPDGEAVLTVLDLADRSSRRIATRLDLRTTPVWLGSTGSIVVQRRGPSGAGTLVQIDGDGRERILLNAAPGRRLFPAAASPDGSRIYVADSNGSETRLRVLDTQAGERDLGVIAEGTARGYTLAADGNTLAFLRFTGADRRYRAFVIDLNSGAVTPLRPDQERLEDTGIVWAGDGFAVTSVTSTGGGLLLGPLPGRDQARANGFDAAAAAPPGGGWLAVRSFQDGDPGAPGPETLQIVDGAGRRVTVTGEGGVSAIGWTGT